jgi:hypothetical protein
MNMLLFRPVISALSSSLFRADRPRDTVSLAESCDGKFDAEYMDDADHNVLGFGLLPTRIASHQRSYRRCCRRCCSRHHFYSCYHCAPVAGKAP